MSAPLLCVRGVIVRYGEAVAVDRASIDVDEGELVALLGANGAGKSTLLKSIIGSAQPDAGSITFAGTPLHGLAPWERARRGIGISPEGRRIFPGLSVRENLIVAGAGDTRDTARQMDAVFQLFPSLEDRANTQGWQLSGGQQQMLAIGRAMMRRPRLLLLDEPTLGLAPNLVEEVVQTVRRIASGGRAVLIADQNAAAVLKVADRSYALQTGRIVAQGRMEEMRDNPAVVAAFLGE
jgi:branched-chain amino acid transport system ATP-binding protein